MTGSTLNQVTLQIRAQHRHKKWQVLVSVLASIVVFVTTYLLILPAITMETKTYCGYEEHIHTDECYSCYAQYAETGVPPEHSHDDCELICGYEEHEHTEMCYINCHTVLITMTYDSSLAPEDEMSEISDAIDIEDESAVNAEVAETEADEAETDTQESEADEADSADVEDADAEEEDDSKIKWERHITVRDGDILLKYLEDFATLPNGMDAKKATWYNAETGEEISLTAPVVKNLELYADFDEVFEEEEPEEEESEEETTEPETTTETTTEKVDNSIVELADVYTYENDAFIVKLNVKGTAKLPENEEEITSDAEDEINLVVELADDSEDSYKNIEAYAGETRNALDVVAMQVMQFRLLRGDDELDLSACEVKAEITPTDALLNDIETLVEKDEEDNHAEIAAAISAYEMVDDEINELDSIYPYDEDEDKSVLQFNPTANTFALFSSTTANPHFTVEYKAFIDVLADTGDVSLDIIIDTSSEANGGKALLPTNTATPKVKNICLDYIDGSDTVGTVAMKKHYDENNQLIDNTWRDIFTKEEFEYIKAPNIDYFNKFYAEDNYELVQVKVSQNGVWHAFVGDLSKLHFTNRPETATDLSKFNTWIALGGEGKNNAMLNTTFSDVDEDIYVLIDDTTVIQLAAKPTTDMYNNDATFYDYDITDGYIYTSYANSVKQTNKKNTSTQANNVNVYANTKQAGINSAENYNASSGDAYLSFGNANTGVTHNSDKWLNLYPLNQANRTGAYKFCSYGLVQRLDENGNIVYSDGVSAPNLFDEGTAIGKEVYDNYSLDFIRNGDTYTLFAVNGAGDYATNLNQFNNPVCGTTKYSTIWTNNFWPMDSAPSFGTDGHDLKFGDYRYENIRMRYNTASSGAKFPISDDGLDHNAYFGMHYVVEFSLTEDYTGPLEYTFFGDDDMWVFLDGQLVCDIGGVHSTVGEYVNLWDYLDQGTAGKHTLSFFYTERGASGSSCFMQFTLPSVASATPEQNTGELRIEKEVTGPLDTEFEFTFDINFTDANGDHLLDDYSYSRYTADGELIEWDIIVWDGGTFRLRNGEYIIIKYLPNGTKFTVSEHEYDEFNTSIYLVSDGEVIPGSTTTGTIDIGKEKQIEVRILNEVNITLPSTGGAGTIPYILSGLILSTAALIYGYTLRYKRKKGDIRKTSA